MLNKANLRDDIFTSLIQFAEMISVISHTVMIIATLLLMIAVFLPGV